MRSTFRKLGKINFCKKNEIPIKFLFGIWKFWCLRRNYRNYRSICEAAENWLQIELERAQKFRALRRALMQELVSWQLLYWIYKLWQCFLVTGRVATVAAPMSRRALANNSWGSAVWSFKKSGFELPLVVVNKLELFLLRALPKPFERPNKEQTLIICPHKHLSLKMQYVELDFDVYVGMCTLCWIFNGQIWYSSLWMLLIDVTLMSKYFERISCWFLTSKVCTWLAT